MANPLEVFTGLSNSPRPNHWLLIALGWIVFLGSFVTIGVVSLTAVSAPPSVNHMDKLLHAGAYAVITAGLLFALPKRALPGLFIFAFAFGLLLEFLQGTLAVGRTASLYDALANGFGSLLVIFVWLGLFSQLKSNPVKRDFPK